MNKKFNKGFTLLEVMISVFVLSIGLLGLAGLQLTSLKHGHSAFLRSQATLHAYSILDDIRANQVNIADYAIALSATSSGQAGLAKNDVDAWLANLGNELPSGDGSVVVAARRVTVNVQWSDRDSASTTKTFTVISDI